MLYVLICTDKADEGLQLRLANRRDHLEYLKSLGATVKVAGPFTSADGSTPVGSLIVVEAENTEAAQAIADADPYSKAGVFSSVTIQPWKVVVNQL